MGREGKYHCPPSSTPALSHEVSKVLKGLVWVFGFTHMWEELGEWGYRRLKMEDQRNRHEKFQPQILEQVEKPVLGRAK